MTLRPLFAPSPIEGSVRQLRDLGSNAYESLRISVDRPDCGLRPLKRKNSAPRLLRCPAATERIRGGPGHAGSTVHLNTAGRSRFERSSAQNTLSGCGSFIVVCPPAT